MGSTLLHGSLTGPPGRAQGWPKGAPALACFACRGPGAGDVLPSWAASPGERLSPVSFRREDPGPLPSPWYWAGCHTNAVRTQGWQGPGRIYIVDARQVLGQKGSKHPPSFHRCLKNRLLEIKEWCGLDNYHQNLDSHRTHVCHSGPGPEEYVSSNCQVT